MAEKLTPGQIAYCAGDIRYLPALRLKQLQEIAGGDPRAKAMELEQALLPTVAKMVLNGLPVDEDAWRQYRGEQATKYGEAQNMLRQHFGDINYNSHAQALKAFQSMGAPITDTKKETITILAESADVEVRDARIVEVESLRAQGKFTSEEADKETEKARREFTIGEMAKAFLTLRGSSKRLSMYSPEWWAANVFEGKVHARFWQMGTETGRLSSSDPNLQNQANDARFIYKAPPGYVYVSSDYSQIEVRLMAAWANDPALLAVLESGDVHANVAAQVFQIAVESVQPRQRKLAKAMVFCLLYGGGYNALYRYARMSGSHITIEEAKALVTRFFRTFQGLAARKNWAQTVAANNRAFTITMPHGLQRVLVDKSMAATIILNTTIQGAAASGMKYAMLYCGERGLEDYIGATVHDELVACVPEKMAKVFAKELELCMIDGMARVTDTPVKVETKISKSWGGIPWAD